MFIKVRLLNGFSESLWYKRPDAWQPASLIGAIVDVPLRNTQVPALVIGEQEKQPSVSFSIKDATAIEPMPVDEHYASFIKQLSTYYQIHPLALVKRIRQFVHQKEMKEAIPLKSADHAPHAVTLTHEQKEIVDALMPFITKPQFHPSVIHGVTGSGKTEIYKQLIQAAIAQQKIVLFLLPEVTLAIEFERRLRAELPSEVVLMGFHSATPLKQKRILWQRLLSKEPTVIIGVHLPVLLPIPHLGLIIVDEEHESGYQEKKHPSVNSKEAAIWRAKIQGIPIILGSATPSISTLYNVKHRGWQFFQLKNRFAGSLPTIQTVLLTDHKQRKNFWISEPLRAAITDRLAKKEQIIIFLNRRGFSFFVQCKSCGVIMNCNACSVSLTLHENNILTCHYCGFSCAQPTHCISCKQDTLLNKGIGTQQAVTILSALFPAARIARADLDITTKKKVWQKTMEDFSSGAIDILVGTQTITKGFHFPRVTLVGILWADLNLHFPIFNAAESTLQQLIQVAGRAGRQSHESLVIVQAMKDHRIFSYLNEIDYLTFYHDELETRALIGYPPCKRLIEIELKHTNELQIERESQELAVMLLNESHSYNVQVLGPAKPPVHKIKNTYSRKIYLRGENIAQMITMFEKIEQDRFTSSIFFTPNPLR